MNATIEHIREKNLFSKKLVLPESKNISGKIKELVIQNDPDALVVLFGSRARGDAGDESDWDILVLTNKDADSLSQRLLKDCLNRLELPLGIAISLIVKERTEWFDRYSVTPLFDTIQNEGILL